MIGDTALYVWGSYAMGIALVLTEWVLLLLRDKAIRGHLGWLHGYGHPAAPPESPAGPAAPAEKA